MSAHDPKTDDWIDFTYADERIVDECIDACGSGDALNRYDRLSAGFLTPVF